MKKVTLVTILVILCFSFALANDLQEPSSERIPVDNYNKENLIPLNNHYSRENTPIPEYEFIQEPTVIMTSYYDYMPGSYEGFPIRMQTDNGDGHYLTFFGMSSTTATRRQYWAYLNSDCSLADWGTTTTYDVRQGYGSMGIHPQTGDCIATWHEYFDAGTIWEIAITYDDYALIQIPGFWQTPLVIYQTAPDEYIWPYIYVGPSPLGEDYVRVYHLSKNKTDDPFGNPCEDLKIMYQDVENNAFADLTVLLELGNWNSLTVMTNWRPYSCRPLSQPFAIDYNNPGKVAIIGYNSWLEGDLTHMPVDEGVFVWESYDYGETWDEANLHTDGPTDYLYLVDNIPQFRDNNNNIIEYVEVDISGWHNTALYDENSNLHLTYMQQYGYTDETGAGYFFTHFLPQAEVVWDGTSFTFHEVPGLPGIDPLSGHTVPWEIVGGDTLLYTTIGFSKYPGDSDIFHENCERNAVNVENGWVLQIWADGTYVQLAEDGIPEYLPYAEHPIIFISVSGDNGDTWSEPIELTDIYNPLFDFSEQITAYPNVCDKYFH